MVKVKENLTGRTFGRLKVLSQAEDYIKPNSGKHEACWSCECLGCGTIKTILQSNLKSGRMISCGCISHKRFIEDNPRKPVLNKYDLTGEYGIGWTNGSNPVAFKFDLEDYEKISKYTWGLDGQGYISTDNRKNDCPYSKLHQFVMDNTWIDHINRDRTDSRKQNLRKTTSELNMRNQNKYKNNTSGFTGISFRKNTHGDKGRWIAVISVNKKNKRLGGFATQEEALRVRLQAEYDIYKPEWAPQRHLFSEYNIPDPKLHQYLEDKGIFDKAL